MRAPRILLTGLPASGKTTLAQELGPALGTVVIQEAARDLGSAGLDITPNSTWGTLTTIALVQMARESSCTDGFVADRGAVDLLAYASLLESRTDETKLAAIVAPAVRSIVGRWYAEARYDLIVYHRAPCGARGAELLARHPDYMGDLALAFDAVIRDFRVPVLSVDSATTTEDRVAVVRRSLNDLS
jgi:AAA domain